LATEKLESAVRREQITRAGLSLVMAGGVRSLSMVVVAHRVGISPSAIYRHLRNKDELIDAILDHLRARILGNVEAACAESAEPLEVIRRTLMRQIEMIRENQAIPRILFAEDLHVGHPERKALIHGTLVEYLRRLEELVRKGQAEGSIREDVDPGAVSVMFLGIFQPVGVLWYLSDGRFDATRQARLAWEILRRAIAVPVRESTPRSVGARRSRPPARKERS
jgi:AcrR family transcriptional regulator